MNLPLHNFYFCTTLKKSDRSNSFCFELSPQQLRIQSPEEHTTFFISIYQSSYASWVRVHVYGSKVYAHTPRTPVLIFVVSHDVPPVHEEALCEIELEKISETDAIRS